MPESPSVAYGGTNAKADPARCEDEACGGAGAGRAMLPTAALRWSRGSGPDPCCGLGGCFHHPSPLCWSLVLLCPW